MISDRINLNYTGNTADLSDTVLKMIRKKLDVKMCTHVQFFELAKLRELLSQNATRLK